MKSMKYLNLRNLPSALIVAGISTLWCIPGCGGSNDSGSDNGDGGNTEINNGGKINTSEDNLGADSGIEDAGAGGPATDSETASTLPGLPAVPNGQCSVAASRLEPNIAGDDCHVPDIEECCAHSDCSAKTNGACVAGEGGQRRCGYDACVNHADCGPGYACLCAATATDPLFLTNLVSWDQVLNVCVPAQCLTDSDCGEGQYCVISLDGETIFRTVCTGDADDCRSDSDCAKDALDVCYYSEGKLQCGDYPIDVTMD